MTRTRLDYRAIGKVLDATATEGLELPPNADQQKWRFALSQDISFAYTLFNNHADWTSDSRAKRRVAELKKVEAGIKRLVQTIQDDDLPLSFDLGRHMPQGMSLDHVISGMALVQAAAKAERQRRVKGGFDMKAVLSASDADALPSAGALFVKRMAEAFQSAFNMAPRIVYTDREPSGPFLAFVKIAMAETAAADDGQAPPISPTYEAIAKAFSRSDKDQ